MELRKPKHQGHLTRALISKSGPYILYSFTQREFIKFYIVWDLQNLDLPLHQQTWQWYAGASSYQLARNFAHIKKKDKFCDGVEKLELLHTVDGNVKW